MSNNELLGKHKRLREELSAAYAKPSWETAHINRITSKLAAVERLLTFSGATRPDRVTQGCTICCGYRWVGEDQRMVHWEHDGCGAAGAPCVCHPIEAVKWRETFAERPPTSNDNMEADKPPRNRSRPRGRKEATG